MIDHHRFVWGLLALVSLGLMAVPTLAQVFLPENAVVVKYTGDNIQPHEGNGGDHLQRYRVFLPADHAVKPCGGWPVLIHFDLSGFLSSTDYGVIDPDSTDPNKRMSKFLALVLQNNIAVITATATPSGNVPAGTWTPDPGLQPGEGRFHAPGQTACFDYLDPATDAAEKDAIMIIQHVRKHAGDPTSPYAAHMIDLDRTRVAVHGSSAGAITLMWIAFGPDRRALFDADSNPMFISQDWLGQYNKKTRPDIAILREGAVWWPAQLDTGAGRHFTGPAPGCIWAPTLDDVDEATLQASSALFYEQPVASLNDSLPTYLYYKDAFNPNTLNCLGSTETCTLEDHTQENIHSAWHGMMWWGRHQNARLALATEGEDADPFTMPGTLTPVYDPAVAALAAAYPSSFAQGTPATLVDIDPGSDPLNAANADIVAWLVERFEDLLPNPWTECWTLYRQAPPGPPGVPTFVPNGVLTTTNDILLPISSAPPGTNVEVWISAWPTTLAESGCGEVIANPQLVIPLQADGSGRLTYAIRWEDLPSELANVFQVIVIDAQQPCGFSISDTWIADTQLGG